MKILLIEDDTDLAKSLLTSLRATGQVVDTAADGEAGYLMAATSHYDLIILDYNLPTLNGRDIVKKLRSENNKVAIIILTVKGSVEDKTELINLGADDYLTKPFSFSELLARLKALARRPHNWQGEVLRLRDLELDSDRLIVTKAGQRLNLSTKEFLLLECLLKNKGRVLSRREIMENVWDANADPFSNTIEVHIKNLRKKLGEDGQKMIFTFTNRGYKIDEER